MATLFINEYASLPAMTGGQAMIANEPVVATQAVTYTGTAGKSAAFNSQTQYIGITSSGIFSYRVGDTTVAATTNDFRVPADNILYMAVPKQGFISAIVNT